MERATKGLCKAMLAVWLAACNGGEEKAEGDCDCDPATEYCRRYGSDIAGEPDVLACEPLPAGCETPSCDCLAGTTAGIDFCLEEGGCSTGDDGVILVVCPGG